ncbi:MAG: hypothetical protein PVJ27_04930 [Candidatus Brocadiaceae bacterium]|jgi:beta-lactamase superfamily II metal-dependent hydrolase
MSRLQLDMLPVGDSDAILLEVGLSESPVVILIDGGRNWEDGDRVLRHLEEYYGGRIDHLVLSNMDADHAEGLLHVAENLSTEQIGQAWIQDISRHGVDPDRAVALARRVREEAQSTAVRSMAEHLIRSVETTRQLVQTLQEKGVPVKGAFADRNNHIGPLEVLGPTEAFFEECVRFYDDVEMLHRVVEQGVSVRRRKAPGRGPAHPDEVLAQAVDDPQTVQQASLILLLQYEGDRYLFTGDAGRRAFSRVPDKGKMRDLHWLQVPNHGSKHNLGPGLLDLFSPDLAYISCSGVGINPHPDLLSALRNRGAVVYTTAGSGNIWHRRGDVPARPGYETRRPR